MDDTPPIIKITRGAERLGVLKEQNRILSKLNELMASNPSKELFELVEFIEEYNA